MTAPPFRVLVTRRQLDGIRDAGVPVRFTEPGRAIVDGIDVEILEAAAPVPFLVCVGIGEGTWQACDDGCGTPIVVHPSSPAADKRICGSCWAARLREGRT